MMSNKLLGIMMFVVGAAVGSVVTWKHIEKKYAEIDSVKEVADVKENFIEGLKKEIEEKPNINEYVSKLREQSYTNYSNDKYEKVKKKLGFAASNEVEEEEPYLIPPEEFGSIDDYDIFNLTYFADQILIDESNTIIDNPNGLIGPDALNSFGEYEEDSVFVRNDRLKTDYEILLDQRRYSDVFERRPHQIGE